MKESYYTPEKPHGLIYREAFNDEFSLRNNGGIPTDITYEGGVASFNGTTSTLVPNIEYIRFPISIRIKLKFANETADFVIYQLVDGDDYINLTVRPSNGVVSIRSSSGAAIASIALTDYDFTEWHEITVADSGGSLSIYVDGSVYSAGSVAGWTVVGTQSRISGRGDFAIYPFEGEIDLMEVYNYELSAEEAANLYDNSRYIKPTGSTLLEISAERGVIEDRIGNSFTDTDIEVVRDGAIWTMGYNGTTSSLETTATLPSGSFTINVWAKFNKVVITNTIIVDVAGTRFYIRQTDESTFRAQYFDGTVNLVVVNTDTIGMKWILYSTVFNTITKTLFVYRNGLLLGQDSDLAFVNPASSNFYIGSYSSGLNNLDGKMGEVIISEGAWSAEDISRYYTATKH